MKAAIYCRLSEEDRNKQCETDDSGSIRNQKAMLMQYAAGQGWEIYHIYSDDDYTGPTLSIIQPVFIRSLPPVSRGRLQPSSPRATPSPICSKIWPQKLHLYKNNPLGFSHHFSVYITTFLYIIIHGILIE